METRCLAPEGVFLEARLETSGVVLFEESAVRDLEAVGDGLSRLRNLRFVAEGPFANGDEAQLTVSATDTTGVTVSRTLRLVITRETVPDLP
ncbi:MAG: hypothetical protein F9K43_23450 [Bauldia sp.]|nr:MAG: hypothetical protein F9K43_23450 [Bauldia sp.]